MDVAMEMFLIYSMLLSMTHVDGWRLQFDQSSVTNVTDLDIPEREKYIYIRYSAITSLPAGGFSHLTQCERLYLDSNQIVSVDREAFFGLEELRLLDLSENRISGLQPGTFENLTKLEFLYLNRNKQSFHLVNGVFSGLVNLIEISMNSSNIRSIGSQVFSGMTNLERVYLSRNYNYGINLPATLFQDTPKLELLDLTVNNLQPIPAGIFDQSLNLKSVHLSNSDLGIVSDGLFNNLENLEEVYLGNYRYYRYNSYENYFSSLPAGLFKNSTQLKIIHIQRIGYRLQQLPYGLFDDLENLIDLDLSGNRFTTLPYSLLENQFNLERLDLSSNRLSSLPNFDNLEKLETVDISSNQVSSLPAQFLRNCTKLKYIYLSNNYLSILPSELYYNLKNLKSVKLDSQWLTSLPPSVFKDLYSVTEINVCCNSLDPIPVDTFSHTWELMYLYLQSNELKFLPKGLLKNLHELVSVDIRHNELTTLPEELLTDCWGLKHLHLEHNLLSSLPDDLYHTLQSLTAVELDSNMLITLPPLIFKDLHRVYTVKISNNKLQNLPPGTFRNMFGLKAIDLSNNQLHSLPSDLFQNLPNLNVVDLSLNRWMGPIPTEIFRHSPKIYEIDLEGNNKVTFEELELPDKNVSMNLDGNDFHCDQRMCWLYQRIQSGTIMLIHNNYVNDTGYYHHHYNYWNYYIDIAKCSSPSNLAGIEIADIGPNDIPGCAEDLTTRPTTTRPSGGTDSDPCEGNQCQPGTCKRVGIAHICICPKGFIATQTSPFQCKKSECLKGEYFSVGDCRKCPKGTYSYVGNLVECLKCPAFYTTKAIGSTSIQDCVLSVPCKPGHYVLPSGVCIECPDGTFQTDGYHSKCIRCEKNQTHSTGGPGATYHGFCGKNETIQLGPFKIEFGLPFETNYSLVGSEEYTKMTSDIIKTLDKAMAGVRYFRGFSVNKLSEGSVVADVVVTLMNHPYAESIFTSAFLHLNLSTYFPWPTSSFYRGKYPKFTITSVYPSKGPQNGGTNVTLIGDFLYLHGPFQVHIGSLNCPVYSSNDTTAFCLTAPLKEDNLKNVFQNITISWSSANIKRLTLAYRFMYKSNPVIHSVGPKAMIVSGGTLITVTGSNLNSVSESIMEVSVSFSGRRNQYFQPCNILNDTHCICITPNLAKNDEKDNKDRKPSLSNPKNQCDLKLENSNFKEEIQTNIVEEDIRNSDVFVNFIMDRATNVIQNPEKLTVYPDPVVLNTYANRVDDYVTVWPCTHDRIVIKGSNLKLLDLLWPGAYEVRLGDADGEDAVCKDVQVKDAEITCLPSMSEPFDSKADNTRVFVSVACQTFNVYDLKYNGNPFYCNYMKIGFGIGFGVLVIIIGIIVYCICCKRRQQDGNQSIVGRYPRVSSWVSSLRRSRASKEYTQSNKYGHNRTRHGNATSGAYTNTIMPSISEDAISPGQTRDAYLLPRVSPPDNVTRQRMTENNNREDSYVDTEMDSEVGYFPNSNQDSGRYADYYNQQEIARFGSDTLQYDSHFTSREMYQSTPNYKKKPNRPMSQYVNSQEAGIKFFKGFTGAHYQRGRHN